MSASEVTSEEPVERETFRKNPSTDQHLRPGERRLAQTHLVTLLDGQVGHVLAVHLVDEGRSPSGRRRGREGERGRHSSSGSRQVSV